MIKLGTLPKHFPAHTPPDFRWAQKIKTEVMKDFHHPLLPDLLDNPVGKYVIGQENILVESSHTLPHALHEKGEIKSKLILFFTSIYSSLFLLLEF